MAREREDDDACPESRTLRAYRSIGAIVDDASRCASFYQLGGEGFVCLRVGGDAFQVMRLAKLRNQITSPRMGRTIDSLCATGEWTYAALDDGEIWAFWRGRPHEKIAESDTRTKTKWLMCIGELVVACRKLKDTWRLMAWTPEKTRDVASLLVSDFSISEEAKAFAHVPTYLNKLLLGGANCLELWNLRSQKRVYKYKYMREKESPVSALCGQSGALDVVSVGRIDGRIELIDAKRDVLLFALDQAASVEALCFATAGSDATIVPVLVVGGSDGKIRFWNLETRALLHEEVGHHGHRVLAIAAGGDGAATLGSHEARIITSVGADNAIVQWTLESTAGEPRLARKRDGHALPPSIARWFGTNSGPINSNDADPARTLQLLTASPLDQSLRLAHAVRDVLNTELSQKAGKRAKQLRVHESRLKLPPIIALAACDAKDSGAVFDRRAASTSTKAWASLVTIHRDEDIAHCWFVSRRCMAELALFQPHWPRPGLSASPAQLAERKKRRATSCCLSPCGNFAVIGHADGRCRKYNVQSGEARGEFPASLAAAEALVRSAASVNVPGSLARANRAIERGLTKGQRIDTQQKKKKDLRLAGSAGFIAHRRGGARHRKHEGAVTGLAIAPDCSLLLSAGLDGKLQWWHFSSHRFRGAVTLGAPIAFLERAGDLVALGCDDGYIRIVDARPPLSGDTQAGGGGRLLRKLQCFLDNEPARSPRDLAFGQPLHRTMYAVCGNGSLRAWDLATAALIDHATFRSEATSVAASPTGEFLATTHVDDTAVSLWTDKAAYTRVDAKPLNSDAPPNRLAPHTVVGDEEDSVASSTSNNAMDIADSPQEEDVSYQLRQLGENPALLSTSVTADCASRRSVTLSGQPRGRAETLHALEAISERNRPVEPPKKPENAPFFLPSSSMPQSADQPIPSLDDLENVDKKEEVLDTKRRRVHTFEGAHRCRLATVSLGVDTKPVLEYLDSISPSAVDADIVLLCRGPDDEAGIDNLAALLHHLLNALNQRHDFEIVQAYLHRIIQHHAAVLAASSRLDAILSEIKKAQTEAATRIRHLFNEASCLVDFLLARPH